MFSAWHAELGPCRTVNQLTLPASAPSGVSTASVPVSSASIPSAAKRRRRAQAGVKVNQFHGSASRDSFSSSAVRSASGPAAALPGPPAKPIHRRSVGRFRGNHRKRKVVKPAGVSVAVPLVRVAAGVSGPDVTDGDWGGAGLLRAWRMAGRTAPAQLPFCVVWLFRPGCAGVLPHRASLRSHQPGSPWCRGAARVPTARNRARAGCGGTAHGFRRAHGSTSVRARPAAGRKAYGDSGLPPERGYLMRPPRRSRRGSGRQRCGHPTSCGW